MNLRWRNARRRPFAALVAMALLTTTGCSDRDGDRPANQGPSPAQATVPFSRIDSQYSGGAEGWARFLACWRAAVDARLQNKKGYSGLSKLPPEVNVIEGPAGKETLAKIKAIEAAQGVRLPPSFVDFMAATDGRGWFIEAMGDVGSDGQPLDGVFPADKIGLFKTVEPQTYRLWTKDSGAGEDAPPARYYRYGYQADPALRQDSLAFRTRYFPGLIVVGSLSGGTVILLNPGEVSRDGEMEAWYLSFKSFLERYRSFAELMQVLAYEDMLNGSVGVYSKENLSKAPCLQHIRSAAIQ